MSYVMCYNQFINVYFPSNSSETPAERNKSNDSKNEELRGTDDVKLHLICLIEKMRTCDPQDLIEWKHFFERNWKLS